MMAGGTKRKAATAESAARRRPRPPARPPVHAPHSQGLLLERMLFLSDAVFAIVMTLLALELRFPAGYEDANLLSGLLAMASHLIAFAISFAVVSVFWIAHATMTREIRQFDWAVAWVNLAFLFTLTLTPFATGLLGEFRTLGNAWRLYCLVLIAIGTVQVVLVAVVCRDGGRLVGGLSRRVALARIMRAASPALGFTVALILSLMGFAVASQFAWVTIPLFILAARALFGPREAPDHE